MKKNVISQLLGHPLTRGLDIDNPDTTYLRQSIIQEKGLLRAIYHEWYTKIIQALEVKQGKNILELGSGGGFFSQELPGCITSEVFPCPGVDRVLDARTLPFPNESLAGIVMTDVLHHIPDVRQFFGEAQRCLMPEGKLIMLEPWNSPWSRFIYHHFHTEPFLPDSPQWELFSDSGPLSRANMALPWIIFERDAKQFATEFPQLCLRSISPDYPFCYLASGGVSMRALSPGWSFGAWRLLEKLISPWRRTWAMFALIVIEKVQENKIPEC